MGRYGSCDTCCTTPSDLYLPHQPLELHFPLICAPSQDGITFPIPETTYNRYGETWSAIAPPDGLGNFNPAPWVLDRPASRDYLCGPRGGEWKTIWAATGSPLLESPFNSFRVNPWNHITLWSGTLSGSELRGGNERANAVDYGHHRRMERTGWVLDKLSPFAEENGPPAHLENSTFMDAVTEILGYRPSQLIMRGFVEIEIFAKVHKGQVGYWNPEAQTFAVSTVATMLTPSMDHEALMLQESGTVIPETSMSWSDITIDAYGPKSPFNTPLPPGDERYDFHQTLRKQIEVDVTEFYRVPIKQGEVGNMYWGIKTTMGFAPQTLDAVSSAFNGQVWCGTFPGSVPCITRGVRMVQTYVLDADIIPIR